MLIKKLPAGCLITNKLFDADAVVAQAQNLGMKASIPPERPSRSPKKPHSPARPHDRHPLPVHITG
ncbi:MAG: hypothetical protein LBG65_05450 [Puniceicoccales bacterium]|jgi:hypothetical protein|nr:hypothetical protein [Puniceicoccales bacterium]